jgi:Xaa-Pro aminopeptidase
VRRLNVKQIRPEKSRHGRKKEQRAADRSQPHPAESTVTTQPLQNTGELTMARMIGRREFVGTAASVAMVPLVLGPDLGMARAGNMHSLASLPGEIHKTIKIGEKYQVPTFSKEEYERRWRALQQLMEQKGMDCLLVINPFDLRYVANVFGGRFDEEDYPCVIPKTGAPSLFIPWIELYFYVQDISPVPEIVSASDSVAKAAKKIKDLGLEKGTIGIDSLGAIRHSSYALLAKELPEARFVEASEMMVECRQVKSEAEIEMFRKSHENGEKAFQAMLNTAKPGVTDREMLGAAFGSIISAGSDWDNRILHNISRWPETRQGDANYPYYMGVSERKLQTGDIINWEFYTSYAGYTSDVCLPMSIGKPHPDFVERHEICKEIVLIARDLLRPGHTKEEIDAKVTEFCTSKLKPGEKASIDFKNFCPVPNRPGSTLKTVQPGMVIAIVPVTTWNKGPRHICAATYVTTAGEPQRIGSLPLEIAVV